MTEINEIIYFNKTNIFSSHPHHLFLYSVQSFVWFRQNYFRFDMSVSQSASQWMKTIEYRLKTQFKRKYLNSLNVNFKPTLVLLLLFFLSKQAKKKILNPKFCVCFSSQSKRREKIESKFTECRSCPFTSFIHRLKKRNSLSCEMLTFSKNKMCLFIILLWKHFALHCQLYQSIVKFWKKKKNDETNHFRLSIFPFLWIFYESFYRDWQNKNVKEQNLLLATSEKFK